MPMIAPYIYLLPLQQAHIMHPRHPTCPPSPGPHAPPSTPPTVPREPYSHPHYPPASASLPPQYELQASLGEPSQLRHVNKAGYPASEPPGHSVSCHVLPWQQHHMAPPRNTTFPLGYPSPYPGSQTSPQGYQPPYLSTVPVVSLSPMGYRPSPAQGPPQHLSGDILPGQGSNPVAAAANPANASSRAAAPQEQQGDGLTRRTELVEPVNKPRV